MNTRNVLYTALAIRKRTEDILVQMSEFCLMKLTSKCLDCRRSQTQRILSIKGLRILFLNLLSPPASLLPKQHPLYTHLNQILNAPIRHNHEALWPHPFPSPRSRYSCP